MTATLSPVKAQQSGVFDLQELLRTMAKTNVTTTQMPVETRKSRREAFARPTAAQRQEFADLAETLPDVVAVYDTDTDAPVVLTPLAAHTLMEEFLAIKAMQDSLAARESRVRAMVFGSVTAQNLADYPDAVDAELEPGFVDVPKTGKRFAREGGGRKDPTWDVVGLKADLGPEAWAQVSRTVKTPRQIIAATTREEVDEVGLAAWMVMNGDVAMDVIAKHLVPGDPKPSRLNVRTIPAKVDEQQ